MQKGQKQSKKGTKLEKGSGQKKNVFIKNIERKKSSLNKVVGEGNGIIKKL